MLSNLRGYVIIFFMRTLSWLPFSILENLGALIGRVSYYLPIRSKHTAQINLLHCFPEKSSEEQKQLVKNILKESAKTLLEMAAIWHWPSGKTCALIHQVQGQNFLGEALAKDKGLILLAPHLGNWEIVVFFASRIMPTTALYAPGKIAALDRLMYSGRTQSGSRLVPTTQSGVGALLKALKAGECIMLLPDQVPDKKSGVFAPFFGQPALTMTLLPSLAARTQAPVLCCYAQRRSDQKGFDIVIHPAHPELYSSDIALAAKAVNLSVESCVTQCFDQYQWGYKRFRKPPPGKQKIYDK